MQDKDRRRRRVANGSVISFGLAEPLGGGGLAGQMAQQNRENQGDDEVQRRDSDGKQQ